MPDSVILSIAQNGPWALVALMELFALRVLWVRYEAVQEARIREKESVVKALTEQTQLAERLADMMARRRMT